MNKPSFHERLWDLQQRKQGEARLKMTLEMARIWEKIALNSSFGKLGAVQRHQDTKSKVALIFERRRNHLRELERLVCEFRPF